MHRKRVGASSNFGSYEPTLLSISRYSVCLGTAVVFPISVGAELSCHPLLSLRVGEPHGSRGGSRGMGRRLYSRCSSGRRPVAPTRPRAPLAVTLPTG